MGYTYPVGDVYVSDDWQGHRNRNPPSQEPGTDYACRYGTVLRAAGNGIITDRKVTTSGPMGRFVRITLDDGRTTRSLHMQEVRVALGQRVTAGQQLGLSGASANGSDWGVGVHTHQTLWPRGAFQDPTIDFEKYVGGSPPPTPTPQPPGDDEEDEDMAKNSAVYYKRTSDGVTVYFVFNTSSGWWMEYLGGTTVPANSNNALAGTLGTDSYANVTEAWVKAAKSSLDAVKPKASAPASKVEVTNFADIPPTQVEVEIPPQKITLTGSTEPQG